MKRFLVPAAVILALLPPAYALLVGFEGYLNDSARWNIYCAWVGLGVTYLVISTHFSPHFSAAFSLLTLVAFVSVGLPLSIPTFAGTESAVPFISLYGFYLPWSLWVWSKAKHRLLLLLPVGALVGACQGLLVPAWYAPPVPLEANTYVLPMAVCGGFAALLHWGAMILVERLALPWMSPRPLTEMEKTPIDKMSVGEAKPSVIIVVAVSLSFVAYVAYWIWFCITV